jgi:hypothetical protein
LRRYSLVVAAVDAGAGAVVTDSLDTAQVKPDR